MSTSDTNSAPESPSPRSPRKPRAKQSVPISVFLGIMVVPLAAAASMFLVSPHIEEPAALAAEASPEVAVAGVPDLAQDLLAACGPIGIEMIELEKAGSLTALQAAALDALRPICSQQGNPLPEPSDSQTVQAVLTRSGPVASGPSAVGSDDDDRDDHDDDWDDSLDSDDSDDWDDSLDSGDSDDWDD